MPNQLPKNQNQSNFLSFNNEKHLNLIDSVPVFEQSQEERITNFLLIISIFLGVTVSIISYLNLTSTKTIELDSETLQSIEEVKAKETFIFELKKDTDFLNKYKEAKATIKIKQGVFYEEISAFMIAVGRPPIESLNFTQTNNIYKFKLVMFSKDSNIETKFKEFEQKNKKFSNLKIETIEKLPDSKETKYTIEGEIDGR